jgi:Spy/CpxP family protein refolding chaperone
VKLVGELIELVSDRAGLRNLREVGERLKTGRQDTDQPPVPLKDRNAQALDAVGSDVLDVGQFLIAELKGTTGEGEPDTGARFGHAHSAFDKAGETMHAANHDDSWDGSAARSYADQNTRQQLRTEAMSAADLEVHRVLYREAAQITLRRGCLDDQSDFLAYTSYASFPLQFIPEWGEAAKLALELQAVQTALVQSAWHIYQLHSEVNANATELQQAIGRYRSVVETAEKPGANVDYGPPAQSPREAATTTASPTEPSTGGAVVAPYSPAPTGAVPVALPLSAFPLPNVSIPPPTATPPAATAPASAAPRGGAAPMSAAGALGSMVGSVAGLLTTVALAAGQRAAPAAHAAEPADDDGVDDDPADRDEKNRGHDRPGDVVASDGASSERAPIEGGPDSERDQPHPPATVRLDPNTSPGPPTEMSSQDRK